MNDRDFKGVWIPKEVWLDNRLTMLEKGILVEIDSLDMSDDGCWASNEYLATFCQCSIPKVANAVSKLVNLGYLRRESFDGRHRKLKSSLSFFNKQTYKNYMADLKKVSANNITNNKENNSISSKRAKDDIPPGFISFWSVYPRKVAKQNALRAWGKTGANASQSLTNTILADIRRRLEGEWKEKELKYIPHPTTYLNQRRWEDEDSETDMAKPEPVAEAYDWRKLSEEEQRAMEDRLNEEEWAREKQSERWRNMTKGSDKT